MGERFCEVRSILIAGKGQENRRKLTISIDGPYLLDSEDVDFQFDPGSAVCNVYFDLFEDKSYKVFGVDCLHALELAIEVEPYLKKLEEQYDLFWLDGSPYFD